MDINVQCVFNILFSFCMATMPNAQGAPAEGQAAILGCPGSWEGETRGKIPHGLGLGLGLCFVDTVSMTPALGLEETAADLDATSQTRITFSTPRKLQLLNSK